MNALLNRLDTCTAFGPGRRFSSVQRREVPVVTNTAKGQTTPLQRNALRKFRINIEEVAAFKHFEVSQVWDLGQRGVITVDNR